jgi:hypothetical protein
METINIIPQVKQVTNYWGSEKLMVTDVELKTRDDRPRPIWRLSFSDLDKNGCRMHDIPIEDFICPQARKCQLRCTQKRDQYEREDYVRHQRVKALTRVGQITKQNGNGKC